MPSLRVAVPAGLSLGQLRRAGAGSAVRRWHGLTMGTRWSVSAVVPPSNDDGSLQVGIQAVLDGVVAEMSNWEPDSDLSRFNRAGVGDWRELPAGFMTVLQAGLAVAAASSGAFDPTIGALVDHWGFGPAGPQQRQPAAAPTGAGWQAIEIDGTRARKLAPLALDFSGIAKGFGVDAVASWLGHHGIPAYLVEVGGELRGQGIKPDGQPWWVDVEAVPGLAVPPTRVALCGLAIATSGDYRRFRTVGSQRISHSIDPRTGAPVENHIASVSVLHASAMLADAWATALTVLGQADGMALAGRENLAAAMVARGDDGGTETLSPAFAAMLA